MLLNLKMEFVNCIPSWEIDKMVLGTNVVAIKCEFKCSCYNFWKNSEFYICNSKNFITKKDLVSCLTKNNFKPGCDHYFLEDFIVNTNSQVTAFFGS